MNKLPLTIDEGRKLGMILAREGVSQRVIWNMAYSYFEENNNHAVCSIINWIADIYDWKHVGDTDNISWLVANLFRYEVNATQNNDGSWNKKKFKAEIKFKEI